MSLVRRLPPSTLEQAVLALRGCAPTAARHPGRLGERGIDFGEDRALGSRGHERLRDPVDMYVGAPPVSALGGFERDEGEDAIGTDEAPVAE